MKHYDTLVLSGGSVRGFAILGALQNLQERGYLKTVKYFAGTSIGGVLVYLMAIGFSAVEVLVYVCTNNIIEKLQDQKNGLTDSLLKQGLYNYGVIEETLSTMTMEKLGYIPTLNDVYTKLGKILVFTTFNLTKQQKEYIHFETHPMLSCLDALHMTCNLPFIFPPLVIGENEYIDGGVIENFPLSAFTDVSVALPRYTLGINLSVPKMGYSGSMAEKIIAVVFTPINECERLTMALRVHKKNVKIITIDTGNIGLSMSFALSQSQKMDLFSCGFNSINKALKKTKAMWRGQLDETVGGIV